MEWTTPRWLLAPALAAALFACETTKTSTGDEVAPAVASEQTEPTDPGVIQKSLDAIGEGTQTTLDGLSEASAAIATHYTVDRNRLLGYQAYRRKNAAHAATYFLACIAKEPDDVKSHYYLGLVALDQYKDAAYARRHFEQAYTLYQAKKFVSPKRRLADIDLMSGSDEPAVPWPSIHDVADGVAESIYRENDRKALLAFARQAIADRGEVDDYLRLGDYLHKLGDPDSAREAYAQAVSVADPKNPRPHVAFADFYEALGARDRALEHLIHAYGITPSDPKLKQRIRSHGVIPGPTLIPSTRPVLDRPKPKLPSTEGQKLPAPENNLPDTGGQKLPGQN